MSSRDIDEQISDLEDVFREAEEELLDIIGFEALGVQTVSSAEEATSDQRNTVSGGEEEEKEGGSDETETSQDPVSEEDHYEEEEDYYEGEQEEERDQVGHDVTMAQRTKEMTIGGVKFEVLASPVKSEDTVKALFPMTDRKTYQADKLSSLFDTIGRAQKDKFELLTLALEDQDKLEDTYALQMLLESTKKHFTQYDLINVFTIVKYDDAKRQDIIDTKDLLLNHSSATTTEVARSNKWYSTMIGGDLATCFRQNLSLTEAFLMNNMEEGLKHRCLEQYMAYDQLEQGGPLLYKIMMDHLQFNTDAAGKALVTMLEKMKLNEIEGENVDKIVGLVRTTVQRLGRIEHSVTKKSAIPDDLNETLVKVFQTSTVTKFNNIFAHLETKALSEKYASGGRTNTYPTVETLLDVAHNTYYDMSLVNEWTGVTTKAKETAFTASHEGSTITCWNCGGNHTLRGCTQKERQSTN